MCIEIHPRPSLSAVWAAQSAFPSPGAHLWSASKYMGMNCPDPLHMVPSGSAYRLPTPFAGPSAKWKYGTSSSKSENKAYFLSYTVFPQPLIMFLICYLVLGPLGHRDTWEGNTDLQTRLDRTPPGSQCTASQTLPSLSLSRGRSYSWTRAGQKAAQDPCQRGGGGCTPLVHGSSTHWNALAKHKFSD